MQYKNKQINYKIHWGENNNEVEGWVKIVNGIIVND